MGRAKRIDNGGIVYHVINRANGRLRIFKTSLSIPCPNSGKLSGKVKIKAGAYMGAQICVGVSGNAYLTNYVK